MSPHQTMVFIDLTGSTAAYEAVGNAQVAEVISKVTRWIARVIEAHQGRTVKFLGDGVLAQFAHGRQAIAAAVFLQQNHSERLQKWPEPLRMGLKVGMASGPVVLKGDDAFGDAVNLASRLSDMAGSHAIWASESVIIGLRNDATGAIEPPADVRYRALGMVRVRGLAQPHSVFQIEWNEEVSTDLMTVRGALPAGDDERVPEAESGGIALAWLGSSKVFAATAMPIVIGRVPDCHFVISDQRVSRQHARIEWVDGAFVLSDLSSFGTWVRFSDNAGADIQLRRTQCILHSTGEIALGAPFSDFSAPVIAFHVQSTGSAQSPSAGNRSLFDEFSGP